MNLINSQTITVKLIIVDTINLTASVQNLRCQSEHQVDELSLYCSSKYSCCLGAHNMLPGNTALPEQQLAYKDFRF
jgi:hypothetical protein